MKNLVIILVVLISFYSCKSTTQSSTTVLEDSSTQNDTVKISGDNLEYDIIIIEPGFNAWLKSIAKPESYYSLEFLESKNIRYVTEWNNRAMQPTKYNPQLYEMPINYDTSKAYGYELNYKLYNYFIFFQNTFKQNLIGGYIPPN